MHKTAPSRSDLRKGLGSGWFKEDIGRFCNGNIEEFIGRSIGKISSEELERGSRKAGLPSSYTSIETAQEHL